MPASYTSGQPSNPRRHPACWAPSQRSYTISWTPCHGARTPAPLSIHPSFGAATRCLKSRHPFVAAAQQLISFSDNNSVRAAQWADHQWNAEWADNPTRLLTLIPDTGTHTPGMTLPRKAWVRLNRLRTGVRRFHSCLYKWGMASSAACECGAEQTVDHVVLHCPIIRPPHGLTVLDDKTTEWLLNSCPDI